MTNHSMSTRPAPFPTAESNDLDARAAEVASMLAATAQQLTEDDNTSEHSGISKIHGTKK